MPAERQAQAVSVNKPADAITSIVTTFKQRDQWSRKTARDPRVKLMHRHVLRSLALCARADSGGMLVIDPTYADLAKAAHCHKRTAQRAVNVAEGIGIVRKARHSDGRVSNAFELLLQAANPDKNAVPTVTNLAADAGPNGDKFPVPTVTNLANAEGSNGGTAAAVLRLRERKEVSKQESESAERDLTTLNDRPIPEPRAREPLAPEPRKPLTPMQRAEALPETVAAQQFSPERIKIEMGPPATNAWQAGFDRVKAEWPPDHIADDEKAFFGCCRAMDALGDIDDVVDAITALRLERGPDFPDLVDALAIVIKRSNTGRQ